MAYRYRRWLYAACVVGASLASGLVGCKKDAGEEPEPGATENVELYFEARVGDQPAACGKIYPGLGTTGRSVSLADLRWYVYDVKLIDKRGKAVSVDLDEDEVTQWRQVALLDFEDASGDCQNGSPATNHVVRGKVPAGEYTGVSFGIGMPPDLNHGNPAQQKSPLSESTLSWGWLQGHKFFRLDLRLAATDELRAGGFEVHVGSTGCSSDGQDRYSYTHENTPHIELSSFDRQRDAIVLDLEPLLAAAELRSPKAAGDVVGCTSQFEESDCKTLLPPFGLDVDTGKAGATQTIFSVGPRSEAAPARDGGAAEASTGQPDADANTDAGPTETGDYDLQLPPDFPPPRIPADNPLTAAKVELGRHLFYDKRLSGNQTQSCASCHQQDKAFTDGRARGLGSTGEMHPRGSMSLANIVYASTLTWANREMRELERQAQVPMFGEKPVELGLVGKEAELIARLKAVAKYQELFPAAFPGSADPFSVDNVTRAIASFERTLISANSPYDRYTRGDKSAISESAKRGADLFATEEFDCFHCHGGFTFSDQVNHFNQASGTEPFHNTGLYNLDLEGSYPTGNQGLYELTGQKRDKGRFKAPTLRNIAVTAPYMHDGSIATLEEVMDHYQAGGRTLTEGPYAGSVGFQNPNKSFEFIHGFLPNAQKREDLLAFLRSLTDEEFLTNPKYADPWPR